MTIRFAEPDTERQPSLAYKLGAEGNIRWRNMSACKLTYTDNEPDYITVWVAEKPRTAVIEVTQPEYELGSRFKVVFG